MTDLSYPINDIAYLKGYSEGFYGHKVDYSRTSIDLFRLPIEMLEQGVLDGQGDRYVHGGKGFWVADSIPGKLYNCCMHMHPEDAWTSFDGLYDPSKNDLDESDSYYYDPAGVIARFLISLGLKTQWWTYPAHHNPTMTTQGWVDLAKTLRML